PSGPEQAFCPPAGLGAPREMGAPLGEFEWIAGFEALACFFEPGFLQVPLGRALVVGCGRSALSRELAGVFREVVSVDCEPAVVEAMREAEPSLRWVCADCCSGPEMREILEAEGGPFDAVVDKGTLDAVMCVEGMAAALLLECHQALKPGGVYLCASLRGRALLDELFRAGGPCDWECSRTRQRRSHKLSAVGADLLDRRSTPRRRRLRHLWCAPRARGVQCRYPRSARGPPQV
ncbi:unnamed protein product, partial [Prorocentrum cordatum]